MTWKGLSSSLCSPCEGVFRWWAFVSIIQDGCVCQASQSYAGGVALVCQSRQWPQWFSSETLKCSKSNGRVKLLKIKFMQKNKIFHYYVNEIHSTRNYKEFIGGYFYYWQNLPGRTYLRFSFCPYLYYHTLTWPNFCLVGLIIKGHNHYINRNGMDH